MCINLKTQEFARNKKVAGDAFSSGGDYFKQMGSDTLCDFVFGSVYAKFDYNFLKVGLGEIDLLLKCAKVFPGFSDTITESFVSVDITSSIKGAINEQNH